MRPTWLLPLCLLIPPSSNAALGQGCNATANVQPTGNGSQGTLGTPSLQGQGLPQVGQPGSFGFRVSGALPFAPGLLLLSRSEQPSFNPTFNATIHTGPYATAVLFLCDSNGTALVEPGRTSAAGATLCGLDLIAQAAVLDPGATGGAALTNALRFRFGEDVELVWGITTNLSAPNGLFVGIDPASATTVVLGAISGGQGVPTDFALSPIDGKLYVTKLFPSLLEVVDPQTFAVENSFPLPAGVVDALVFDEGKLLAAHQPAPTPFVPWELVEIDPATGQVSPVVTLAGGAQALSSLSVDGGGTLYGLTVGLTGTRIVTLDLLTGQVTAALTLSFVDIGIAMELGGSKFLVTSATGNLWDVDSVGSVKLVGPTGFVINGLEDVSSSTD